MVKLKGPCFSLQASGTIGNVLTFLTTSKGAVVKANKFHFFTSSYSQTQVQAILLFVQGLWATLEPDTKTAWMSFVDYKGSSGYHSFIRQNLVLTHAQEPQVEGPPYFGYCIVGNHIVGEFLTGGDYIDPGI